MPSRDPEIVLTENVRDKYKIVSSIKVKESSNVLTDHAHSHAQFRRSSISGMANSSKTA